MKLNVAVQMDPIARINIRGDSTFALALEAHAPGLRARPAEPEGFDDVKRSLASGKVERNNRLSGSLCDAIVTPQPGELTAEAAHLM